LKVIGGGEQRRDNDELAGSTNKDEDKSEEGGFCERVSDEIDELGHRACPWHATLAHKHYLGNGAGTITVWIWSMVWSILFQSLDHRPLEQSSPVQN